VIRHPDGSVTVTYKLEITRGRKGQRRLAEPAPLPERPAIDPTTVPRITRMLVLGYHFERLVRERKVKNYAEIARLTGLSRARVTQIANLALLPPDVQERFLLCERIDPTSLGSASVVLRGSIDAGQLEIRRQIQMPRCALPS
jgi:hypothetical protein